MAAAAPGEAFQPRGGAAPAAPAPPSPLREDPCQLEGDPCRRVRRRAGPPARAITRAADPISPADQGRRTGSDSRPWMRLLGFQRSDDRGTARDSPGNRDSSAPNAISASSRASGAPMQKWIP